MDRVLIIGAGANVKPDFNWGRIAGPAVEVHDRPTPEYAQLQEMFRLVCEEYNLKLSNALITYNS